VKQYSADTMVPAALEHTRCLAPKPGRPAPYGAASALGLLLFAAPLSAADYWLATESGCKV
jgi:hypothetical protein